MFYHFKNLYFVLCVVSCQVVPSLFVFPLLNYENPVTPAFQAGDQKKFQICYKNDYNRKIFNNGFSEGSMYEDRLSNIQVYIAVFNFYLPCSFNQKKLCFFLIRSVFTTFLFSFSFDFDFNQYSILPVLPPWTWALTIRNTIQNQYNITQFPKFLHSFSTVNILTMLASLSSPKPPVVTRYFLIGSYLIDFTWRSLEI